MIQVEKHRDFKRYFKKLTSKQKQLFAQKMTLFLQDPTHRLLRVHRLKGELLNFFAFSLSGDLRVVFKWPKDNLIILHKIGTHNQVY